MQHLIYSSVTGNAELLGGGLLYSDFICRCISNIRERGVELRFCSGVAAVLSGFIGAFPVLAWRAVCSWSAIQFSGVKFLLKGLAVAELYACCRDVVLLYLSDGLVDLLAGVYGIVVCHGITSRKEMFSRPRSAAWMRRRG